MKKKRVKIKLIVESTEQTIITAATKVFKKRGYDGTTVQEIADVAGTTKSMVNYYFRSKEKLFQIIMGQTLAKFSEKLGVVILDETTSLEKKVELLAVNYIDMLTAEPDLPIFIMSEIRSNGAELLQNLPVAEIVLRSPFMKQYGQAVKNKKISESNPIHFLMNLLGLVVFPFISSPMMKKVGKLNDKQYNLMMEERKKLIPVWIGAMIKT